MIKKGSLIKVIDFDAAYYKRYSIVLEIEDIHLSLRICIVNEHGRLYHFNWLYAIYQVEEVEQ